MACEFKGKPYIYLRRLVNEIQKSLLGTERQHYLLAILYAKMDT